MQVKLWGVRGSLPSPMIREEYIKKLQRVLELAVKSGLNSTSKIPAFINTLPDDLRHVYGGNTTCVTVTSDSGALYILDCGSGIRHLGYDLMKGLCGQGKGILNIFLTHNHWDHIQGLPFFTPIYIKGNILNFYSPYLNQLEILSEQMQSPYFPAPFDRTESTKNHVQLDVNNIEPIRLEDGMVVDFHPMKHPGGSFAYRFKQKGKTFIFATDAEFTGEIFEKSGQQEDKFFKEADLLVIDAQYTLDESFMKFDWGHTSYTMAVNCGIRWKVKNLVLTHHEPAYSDAKLYENYQSAIEHGVNCNNKSMKIHIATEGTTFRL